MKAILQTQNDPYSHTTEQYKIGKYLLWVCNVGFYTTIASVALTTVKKYQSNVALLHSRMYSNNMEFFLFFLRTFSQLHALLESPRLLISEKPATNTVFYVINIKKIPPTCLIRTSTFNYFLEEVPTT